MLVSNKTFKIWSSSPSPTPVSTTSGLSFIHCGNTYISKYSVSDFFFILFYQGEEYGESKDKEVPGGVEINKLKVGEADSSNHTKHDAEDATNNRTWDS